ncbi:hypothetical protein ACJIZ3_011500 [Penstemon smallii]|uniref:Cytochrome P450 n=1 Tax=Penstemon smallii TaxID=265156 RepID=A0ABD3UNK9_9LAMI
METWFIIIVSLFISFLIKSIFATLRSSTHPKLPPGPPAIPFIGNFIWLCKPFSEVEMILRRLKTCYGSLITMRFGLNHVIFVFSHSFAHRALIQKGAVFSDRPSLVNRNQNLITSANYGPTWRLLRRNLTQEILNPPRVRSLSGSRCFVLSGLFHRLLHDTAPQSARLVDHFQYTIFYLLALICFGERLQEKQIKEIEAVLHLPLLASQFGALNHYPPRLGKILFYRRYKKMMQFHQKQNNVLIPIIRARLESKRQRQKDDDVLAYVDTLLDLQLPEENNRKLNETELVGLCGEFLRAGTLTTTVTLQWIMANLVKYPRIQTRLYDEIVSIMGPPPVFSDDAQQFRVVEEGDVQKMPYLKAVVLEGLRRHPPIHFLLMHKVSEDVELDGYKIPRNTQVNFMVAEMGLDPEVWEDPLEFKPERFFNKTDAVDITGSREIKMMPFGAGRRICPAWGLGMLHLEYFVANLIWHFEWTPLEGYEVDLTEKHGSTVVMENPLHARISPRVQ